MTTFNIHNTKLKLYFKVYYGKNLKEYSYLSTFFLCMAPYILPRLQFHGQHDSVLFQSLFFFTDTISQISISILSACKFSFILYISNTVFILYLSLFSGITFAELLYTHYSEIRILFFLLSNKLERVFFFSQLQGPFFQKLSLLLQPNFSEHFYLQMFFTL